MKKTISIFLPRGTELQCFTVGMDGVTNIHIDKPKNEIIIFYENNRRKIFGGCSYMLERDEN